MNLDIPLMRACCSILAHPEVYSVASDGSMPPLMTMLRGTSREALRTRQAEAHAYGHRYCTWEDDESIDQFTTMHLGAIEGFAASPVASGRDIVRAILDSEGSVTEWWAETIGAWRP